MLKGIVKNICFILSLLFFSTVFAVSDEVPIQLERVQINLNDKQAILKGANFFAKNCMVCHTMRYLQNNKIAASAGITLDKMPLKNKEWWLGIVPPDLTLIANVKGADWLYTYFHSFYKDPSRPTGYNNLLAKNVNMMNIFVAYQGEQVLIKRYTSPMDEITGKQPRYYSVLELVKSGSMTPEQFNETMRDLVTFLVYASDPHTIERMEIGYWVIGFLVLMVILACLLKWIYWKRIKQD